MESLFSNETLTYRKKIVFNAGVEASMEYANPTGTFVPRIQLLFSPFGLPMVPIEILGTNVNRIISNFTWTKDRDNPGGILAFDVHPDAETVREIVDIINQFSGNLYSKIWGELGVDLEDLFKVMTLCQLWINGYHVMTGTVRSCIRNASVGNNEKEVSYSITIDELGNLYNRNTLSLDAIESDQLQANMIDAFEKAMLDVSTLQGVSLSVAVKAIVDAFKKTSLSNSFTCSDGFPLSLRLLTEHSPIGGIANLSFANNLFVDINLFQLHSQGGASQSIWAFLKNLIPTPWMEFFTESGGRTIVTDPSGSSAVLFPGFNYIVGRSVPYSNPLVGTVNLAYLSSIFAYDLNVLSMLIGGDFIIITDDMIEQKSLGCDCGDQRTLFHTRYESKAMGGGTADLVDKGIPSMGPINPFASGGMKTFGIIEMFESLDVTNSFFEGMTGAVAARIKKNKPTMDLTIMPKQALSNLLATWFRNQSRYREGTVTTKGIPYARPGMYCLYLPSLSGKKPENLRDIGIYYINSLTHNYAIENKGLSFTTTMNLIRGVPLPTTVAQMALLLFDFEIIPPITGMVDGEVEALQKMYNTFKI